MADHDDFYKLLLDNLYDGVYFCDRDLVITYWNKGAERITGYPASQTVGRSCRDNLLNHITADGVQLCFGECPMMASMRDGQPHESEVLFHHASGYRVPMVVHASPIRDGEGVVMGAVETFSNNESIAKAHRRLKDTERISMTDPLTGVGNRRYLENRLNVAISQDQQVRELTGLLFIDVDDFKAINDTYGHAIGDKILRMVVGNLDHNLRITDLVGRWGGDEFLAMLYCLQGSEDLQRISRKLKNLLERSRLDLPEKSLTVTISIGATLLKPDDTLDSVINRADQLMYQSKQIGPNQITFG